jgi:hypothetical protein
VPADQEWPELNMASSGFGMKVSARVVLFVDYKWDGDLIVP